MSVIVDNLFKETYKNYFDGYKESVVLDKINKVFKFYEPELVCDTVNIIKTCMTLGMTYSDCHDKITSEIMARFPVLDDIDKFILSLVIKIMVAQDKVFIIEDLMKRDRNIKVEVAARYFRVPISKVSEEMLKKIEEASDNFTKQSYSIDDPPVDSWDEYFYNVCRQVARNSKCHSRRIGAVLVWDKGIISTGYNGPPRGVPPCDTRWFLDKEFIKKYGKYAEGKETSGICPRRIIGFESGQGLEICPAGHAERNALINAARAGIATKGTILYMTCGVPCSPCLIEIINSGVREIVVTSLKYYDETAPYLLSNSDIGVRLYDFIK
jgi:dCMP deaminase